MKATIVYHSKKGKTASYARNIALYLWQQGVDVRLSSIGDCKEEWFADTDLWVLGCWTSGYILFGQKPSRLWRGFVQEHRDTIGRHHIILFATYLFHPGSMFYSMQKSLGLGKKEHLSHIASRNGRLQEADRRVLKHALDLNFETFHH